MTTFTGEGETVSAVESGTASTGSRETERETERGTGRESGGEGARERGNERLGELDAVCAQFEQWRRVPGRRHIPDSLWLAAIGLLDSYPVSMVSEHLRLNSARLQQQQHKLLSLPSPPPRVRSAEASPSSPASSRASTIARSKRKRTQDNIAGSQPPIEFVQLTLPDQPDQPDQPDRAFAIGATQTPCSLVIERGDGSRLALRLPPDARLIESLCSSFLKQ